MVSRFLALSILSTILPLAAKATVILAGGSSCSGVFGTVKASAPSIADVIAFADKHFERRGWSSAFLAERIQLAEKFPNSEYYYTDVNREITGSLAVTYAEFSPELLMTKGVPELPMEHALQTRLPRPVGLNGASLITELRTYAIEPEFHSTAKSPLYFAALGSVVRRYERDHSELLDKPVIFTYGDRVSLKLYGAMGFKNLTQSWGDKPIRHAGEDWSIMGITPNQLKRLLKKEYSRYSRNLKDGKSFVLLPDGREVSITVEMGKNDLRYIAEVTEILPGLRAAPKSDVVFAKTGELIEITKLAETYSDPHTGVTAAEGSRIQFFPETGRIHVISAINLPVELEPGVWARKGERVEWLSDGRYLKIGARFYNPSVDHPRRFNGPVRPLEAAAEELDNSSIPIFRSQRMKRDDTRPVHEVIRFR